MSVQEKQRERLEMANAIEEMTEPVVLDMILSKADRQLIVEALRASATPVANLPLEPNKSEPTNITLLMMADKIEGHSSTKFDPHTYTDDLKAAAAILRRTHQAMALMQEIISDDPCTKHGRLARNAIKCILNPQQEVLVVQRDDSKPFGLVGHLIPVDREMEKLLKEARAKVDAMSAAELDEMLHKQGVGWAKSEAQWAKDFREGKTDRD